MQMGKFFPENWGVQLPMYVGYSETYQTPRYDPLQPDLELDDLPAATSLLLGMVTADEDYYSSVAIVGLMRMYLACMHVFRCRVCGCCCQRCVEHLLLSWHGHR